jgi:hypothetical protein
MDQEKDLIIGGKSKSPTKVMVKKLAELISTGVQPEKAAILLGHDHAILKNQKIQEYLRVLLSENYVAADIQREVIRAGRFKLFLKALQNSIRLNEDGTEEINLDFAKLANELSKTIGSDPAIGLNQPPALTLNVDLTAVKDIFEKLDQEPLPIIDVETENEEEK